MRLITTIALLLSLTACPPTTEDDTGGGDDTGPAVECLDVNEDGEPGHPGREFFLNDDGDDFGAEAVYLCMDPFDTRPDNYSPFDGDCNDNNADIHPDADEMCDGIDNDCDGLVDVNALDAIQWYPDNDGDGYGDPNWGPKQCDQPAEHVDNGDDCNDNSDLVYPGSPNGGCP